MLLAFRPALSLLVATWAASFAVASPRAPSLRDPHVASASDPKGMDSLRATPPVVAVADFRATMLSRSEAASLRHSFCSTLGARRELVLVDRERFADLRNPRDFGPLSQCAELSCALELGRQVQADVVVLGEVSKTRRGLSLEVRLVDVPLRVVQENLETKVYPGAEELRTRGIPELVSRLLDTAHAESATPAEIPARTTAEHEAGMLDHPIDTVDRGKKRSALDSTPQRATGTIRQILPTNNKLAAAAGIGGAVSLGLVVVGAITSLAAPARCFTDIDANSTIKTYGDCTGSGLETGEILMDAGFVLGGLSALAGVIAVVQRLAPASPEAPPHRRLVFFPRIDPFNRTWGLATRLDF